MVETCILCKEVVMINRKGRIYPHATYQHGTAKRCATSQMTYKAAKSIFGGISNEKIQTVEKTQQKELQTLS